MAMIGSQRNLHSRLCRFESLFDKSGYREPEIQETTPRAAHPGRGALIDNV